MPNTRTNAPRGALVFDMRTLGRQAGSARTQQLTVPAPDDLRLELARVPVGSASNEPLRPGNLGNGALRLPGQWNLDFSLGKNVSLTERFKLQIRADFFNVLNHTNFNAISADVTSGTFGQFTSTAGARIIQLNARLSW